VKRSVWKKKGREGGGLGGREGEGHAIPGWTMRLEVKFKEFTVAGAPWHEW